MKKIVTEIAVTEDVGGLVELEEMCFETDRLEAKQFRYFIKKPTTLVVTAKHKNKIIAGAIVLFRKNSRIGRLYSLAVHPEYRMRGVARTINNFMENSVLKFRCREIRLEVRKDNKRAIKFYEKNGYESFGEYKKFYEDGADALRLHKVLGK
jgi:ribosomal protein S18 acetylase RimI-like enzyme